MAARLSKESQALRAARALSLYSSGIGVRQVAEQLGISYGTAYADIRRIGGDSVFRNRGTRSLGEDKIT